MYVNVQAIVLSARKSGENDRRLSLYTRELGRLSALAVGVGRPKSKLAPAVEPSVEANYRLWMAPEGGFARITGGGISASFPGLRGDWSRMNTALFFCEWTEKLTAVQQPHPEKFDLLRAALSALEKGDDPFLRAAFLAQFLERAGYSLGQDIFGPVRPEDKVFISALRAYDFLSSPNEFFQGASGLTPAAPDAAAPDSVSLKSFSAENFAEASSVLEEKMLKFVSPLLDGPLKTQVHRRSLENYLAGAKR
jgi:hypothetical protein